MEYYYVYNTDLLIMAPVDIHKNSQSLRRYKSLNERRNYSGITSAKPQNWAKEYTKVSFIEYSKATGITIKNLLL